MIMITLFYWICKDFCIQFTPGKWAQRKLKEADPRGEAVVHKGKMNL